MTDLTLVSLPGRAVLRLAGPEARPFLQGLISNDVDRLAPGRPLYAALLTPQGRYLFDFILVADGDAILADVERERAPELRQRLLMYRLRSKVTIEEPEPRLAVLALFGPDLGTAPAGPGALSFLDPRLPELGLRIIVQEGEVSGLAQSLQLELAAPETYERHRLRLGVPDGSRDLVPQKALLLETGFEELHGVSFDKGCFVGQELTARMKHRGLVKKRLFPVRVEGALPEPRTVIRAGGQEAGEMRSGLDDRALALLRLEPAEAAMRGGIELRAGASRIWPEMPGWMRLGAGD